MYTYQARVVRVVDGDTVDLMIDLGFGIHRAQRVRLDGIDAPEIRGGDPLVKAAGLRTKAYLEEVLAEGKLIKLISTHYDKWGRAVGKIWREEGIEIGEELLKLGLAKPYREG
jgi:micrococcal nuclease